MNLSPNEFEILLCEFSKQDIPKNFTVEHDTKEIGDQSGSYRQIDTKIKGKLGVSDILICGEAKNWNKPVGIEVIDAVVGKYFAGEIKANKAVVFSNMGFTKPSIARALKEGIELIQPKELGKPIVAIPHILAIGNIGTVIMEIKSSSPQENLITADESEYRIVIGNSNVTIKQYIYQAIKRSIRSVAEKDLDSNFSNFILDEKNLLYELTGKENFKYYADFKFNTQVEWKYLVTNLPTGILTHLNCQEDKVFSVKKSKEDIFRSVFASNEKQLFDTKEGCIEFIEARSEFNHIEFGFFVPEGKNSNRPNVDII